MFLCFSRKSCIRIGPCASKKAIDVSIPISGVFLECCLLRFGVLRLLTFTTDATRVAIATEFMAFGFALRKPPTHFTSYDLFSDFGGLVYVEVCWIEINGVHLLIIDRKL